MLHTLNTREDAAMSEVKHTPWTARPSGDSDTLWTVEDANGSVVFFGMDESVARLIAAAPELLAALKALAGPMEAVRDDQASLGLRFGTTPAARAERARLLIDWIKANADTVDDSLEVAFAAAAKAEGR